jgi:HD superfamily phosphohydrolase
MSKVFNDPIHGHIELSPLSVAVIDTPQFQRLRDISQLGGVYYVFPGAASKRFEHSIGVAHLSRTFITQLRNNQPSLGISEVDTLVVELAGLCHDLGHGPFSHLFDGRVLPALGASKDFCHEHASVQLFDLLIEENDLAPLFESYGLTARERHLIKELILGDEDEATGLPNFKWVGQEPRKMFLYDIVANKRNGIDVDKMDYFMRDTHMLNIAASFDARRLMRFARVYKVAQKGPSNENENEEGDVTEICFHKKESWNIMELFHTRYSLYKRAYLHKVSTGVDMMIGEALILANDFITVPGRDGEPTKMSESWQDMHAYWRYTEYIVRQIQHSTDPNLGPAKAYIDRVMKRDLFVCVGELLLDEKDTAKKLNGTRVLEGLRRTREKMLSQYGKGSPEAEAAALVESDDMFVSLVKMGWGSNRNPIDNVTFYLPKKSAEQQPSLSPTKGQGLTGSQSSQSLASSTSQQSVSIIDQEDVEVGVVDQDNLSRLLPSQFEERCVRVYARHKKQQTALALIFKEWNESERGKAPPSPLSPVKRRRVETDEH